VAQLDAQAGTVEAVTARRLLTEACLTGPEVARYVERHPDSYARRAVARRETYELLVLTWQPGQRSVAHDHAGSLCGLKVVQGTVTEQRYESGPDGRVRVAGAVRLGAGDVTIDPGVIIHSLANAAEATELLVTVHLYSPPLPEVRRYAVATEAPAAVYVRARPAKAPVMAVIGGGFTGAMTVANLMRAAKGRAVPVHVVLIDRQPAAGDGVAYRTNDARHLLNVPAAKMSAWPEEPEDFLNFARRQNAATGPGEFLPRRTYGQYVRETFQAAAQSADPGVSVEMIRDEATGLRSAGAAGGWVVTTAGGREVAAQTAIIALGHRPPAEQFIRRWHGPRTRFVADPWAALVLSQIGPDESVLVLGSGLTAVDALLTLDRADRTAPITVVSRHGLLPQSHAPAPPADVTTLVATWMAAAPLKVRDLVHSFRQGVAVAAARGVDWRSELDGLRPFIAKIWQRLRREERSRFLRHVRPFWEIHRHRMAPAVAAAVAQLRARKVLDSMAGALVSATADADGVDICLSVRGSAGIRRLRVHWVINCTGPGIHHRRSTHPLLQPLIESGALGEDPLGLGLLTDDDGRAIDAQGRAHADLFVAGTLRKATLWESTAVPELRQQAAAVAKTVLKLAQAGDFRDH
jgi:uncharacterized NAD(P)/FAD-binding protein YdhS/predicted metal-dependent enzyme (double-stranded beta helix superfamily)